MTLSGLYTALITPFAEDGSLDLSAFTQLVQAQIAAGVDGLVITGSTGEAATLSTQEKTTLWATAVEVANGRIPIIAGSGSNNTAETASASKAAADVGASALLLVTPYYNKPTTAGLIAHYSAVAEATSLPQIIYNVPGRTATNMSAEAQLAIFDAVPTVIGSKEASANLSQIATLAAQAPSHVRILAGDDDLALPTIGVGGYGVIAVISNYAPSTYGELIRAACAGNLVRAQELHASLLPWYKANFLESNPIPVKYIMHKAYGTTLRYRLPLTPPSSATRLTIDALWSSRPF